MSSGTPDDTTNILSDCTPDPASTSRMAALIGNTASQRLYFHGDLIRKSTLLEATSLAGDPNNLEIAPRLTA
jgi:hypothetical protein